MAEPESIMQLGIEAARDGDKEQSRNLFRLLTKQEPNNIQAWLWLAGVAEDRDERQAALERVILLDPGNEMAFKGLQALGARPTGRLDPDPSAGASPPSPASEQAASRSRYDIDDDDPYAVLDSLSDAMNESPAAVRRTESYPESYAETEYGSERRTSPTAPIPSLDTGQAAPSHGETARREVDLDDDDETVPARRGANPLLVGLIGVALVAALLIWIVPIFFRGDGNNNIAGLPPEHQTAVIAQTNQVATQETNRAATSPANGALTGTTRPQPGQSQTDVPTVGPTNPPATPATPVVDPATANPAIVPANTPLESNGWLYDFNRPTYAAPIIGALNNVQPQGRFVVVLVFVVNRTGQEQTVPANFFVLKDAQGRVYEPRPNASAAYVTPGINADLNQQQSIPSDGLTRSVALVFDVNPDASNLVFFAPSNPSQGWLVLQSI
ncbi:MAG: DUF4352 domain-containing protein [Chloroflexales bacterium]|nr:DUF4352 domain-containing protein [Chloroflexales bacterium]